MDYTCLNCSVLYTSASVGSLGCSFHPRSFNYHCNGQNYPKNSFDCCGSKLDTRDQFTIDKFTNGCQWVDHVSTAEELQNVLKLPYVCLKEQDFEKLALCRLLFNKDKRFIQIKSDDVSKTITIKNASGGEVSINLMDEYRKLFNLTQDKDDDSIVDSSEIYYRDEAWDLANVITDKLTTAEFFIVFRIPAKKRMIHVKVV